jgi:hypothetical protein
MFVAALAGTDDCSKREIFKWDTAGDLRGYHVMARPSWATARFSIGRFPR